MSLVKKSHSTKATVTSLKTREKTKAKGEDSGKKLLPHPNLIQHLLIPQIITQPIRSEHENIILLDWECECACVR
jgi:hypothetical protein